MRSSSYCRAALAWRGQQVCCTSGQNQAKALHRGQKTRVRSPWVSSVSVYGRRKPEKLPLPGKVQEGGVELLTGTFFEHCSGFRSV